MAHWLDYGHGICAIDAHYQRPGLAALYLLIEGGQAAFIDTGTSRSVPDALDVLRQKGLAPESVDYVMPTHAHLDHAGGAGEMMRRFPNARLVAHPRAARHLIDPTKLITGVTAVYGAEAVACSFGEDVPVPAERVIEAPDGFTLSLGGRALRFLDTPGHARHHFCVWDERSRGIFTGDTFGVSYRELDTENGAFVFPTTTPVQFEPRALHDSIDRLMRYRPRQLYLTHFGRITQAEHAAQQITPRDAPLMACSPPIMRTAGPLRVVGHRDHIRPPRSAWREYSVVADLGGPRRWNLRKTARNAALKLGSPTLQAPKMKG